MILQLLSSICFLPLPHSSVAFVKSPPKKRARFESLQQKKGSLQHHTAPAARRPAYRLRQNRFVFLTLQLQQYVHFLGLLQLLLHSLAEEKRDQKSHVSAEGFEFYYLSYFNKQEGVIHTANSVFPTHAKARASAMFTYNSHYSITNFL